LFCPSLETIGFGKGFYEINLNTFSPSRQQGEKNPTCPFPNGGVWMVGNRRQIGLSGPTGHRFIDESMGDLNRGRKMKTLLFPIPSSTGSGKAVQKIIYLSLLPLSPLPFSNKGP
jgi:hypothetical protein